MNRVLLFFSALAGFLILCQWFVFVSVRKHLFQRHNVISRKVAYSVLGLLGLTNLLAVRLGFGALSPDTPASLITAISYFSYLGWVLILCFFFLGLEGVFQALHLKDIALSAIKSRMGRAENLSDCQQGCDGPEGCEASPPEALCVQKMLPGCKAEQVFCKSAGQSRMEDQSRLAPSSYGLSPTRREFLRRSAAVGLVAAGGYAGYGIAGAYRRPVVDEFDLYCHKLDGLARPLTFIQVTDFHFGMFFDSPELEQVVKLVNALEGDAVFITGDIFHSPLTPVEHAIPILKQFKARRLGNFVVLGNHDFYAGEWRSAKSIRQSGLSLLRNEWITFKESGAEIHLGGIDDPRVNWVWGSSFPNFPAFIAKAPRSKGMRIVLSHRPSILPFAAGAGIDFVLSGHIHGGQMIFPYPGIDRGVSIARLASPFTHGWYHIGESRMYLNRGIGLTFVPWRINCPPQIAVFHLHPDGSEKIGVRKRASNHA